MRYSIILATVDRARELHPLLLSLKAQTCLDFELLVIDQNPDDRLKGVLEAVFARAFSDPAHTQRPGSFHRV